MLVDPGIRTVWPSEYQANAHPIELPGPAVVWWSTEETFYRITILATSQMQQSKLKSVNVTSENKEYIQEHIVNKFMKGMIK